MLEFWLALAFPVFPNAISDDQSHLVPKSLLTIKENVGLDNILGHEIFYLPFIFSQAGYRLSEPLSQGNISQKFKKSRSYHFCLFLFLNVSGPDECRELKEETVVE